MGHNTTRQAAVGRIRAQQFADYRGWLLVVRCEGCQRQSVLRIDQLAPRWLEGPSRQPWRVSNSWHAASRRRPSGLSGTGRASRCWAGELSCRKRCAEAGARPSMDSVGDAYDDATAESFFSTLEAELLSRRRLPSRPRRRWPASATSGAGTTRSDCSRPWNAARPWRTEPACNLRDKQQFIASRLILKGLPPFPFNSA